jgi:hypothetical protein
MSVRVVCEGRRAGRNISDWLAMELDHACVWRDRWNLPFGTRTLVTNTRQMSCGGLHFLCAELPAALSPAKVSASLAILS